jgi:hypothetical protein
MMKGKLRSLYRENNMALIGMQKDSLLVIKFLQFNHLEKKLFQFLDARMVNAYADFLQNT